MGNAMAQNVQKTLRQNNREPVHFYNRTASRGLALKDLGGVQCASVAEVVNISDVVFISVSMFRAIGGHSVTSAPDE